MPESGTIIIAAIVILIILVLVYIMLYGIGWAFKPQPESEHDLAEELQGTFALVTKDIASTPGEISYEFRDEKLAAPAISIDGAPISKGTDVVIEQIDKSGIAHVELWSVVEKRL